MQNSHEGQMITCIRGFKATFMCIAVIVIHLLCIAIIVIHLREHCSFVFVLICVGTGILEWGSL